jgi:hypothetical protein
MATWTENTIAVRFIEFCGKGNTLMFQSHDHGVVITCRHGRYPIVYSNVDVSLSMAKDSHEKLLSSSKETVYNWHS